MMPDLDHEATPPPTLRTRVLRTLRARGRLRPATRWGPRTARIAAAVLLFALGGVVGRRTAPAPPGTPATAALGADRYMLLLYAGDQFQWDVPEARLVEEYRAWATSLRAARFVRGERLGELEVELTPRDATGPAPLAARVVRSRVGVSGYFLVEAESWEQAVALARTCPHLRYGGRIVLRAVVPT